jgi:hypothetical protein
VRMCDNNDWYKASALSSFAGIVFKGVWFTANSAEIVPELCRQLRHPRRVRLGQ